LLKNTIWLKLLLCGPVASFDNSTKAALAHPLNLPVSTVSV
jgi:hypothetical protein